MVVATVYMRINAQRDMPYSSPLTKYYNLGREYSGFFTY